jgi:hypothetical protein
MLVAGDSTRTGETTKRQPYVAKGAACQRCKAAKRRCDGEQPCARCMRLGLGCSRVNVTLSKQGGSPARKRSRSHLGAAEASEGALMVHADQGQHQDLAQVAVFAVAHRVL